MNTSISPSPTPEPPHPISYEFLAPAKAHIDACVTTIQSVVVVATILAGLSSQLLGIISSDEAIQNITSSGGKTALRCASYIAILFNGITTIISLFLIDQLGSINLRSIELLKAGERSMTDCMQASSRWKVVRHFGSIQLKCILVQWILCLVIGIIFFVIQTLTYIWLREGSTYAVKSRIHVTRHPTFHPRPTYSIAIQYCWN
ncbi:hypothetical protein B0H14DRAFT_2753277 [Mycena olivaceomarginata]|nr:hypothetical protein B0H14DRAFT_2753277 [Mycena olivaceomarginata]